MNICSHLKKVWEWDSQQLGVSRTLYTTALSVLGITIPVYVVTLFFSHPGEIAGALGSFLGGIIGAGGAVAAVYLALSRQRDEEIVKVSEAVKVEVTAFAKYVIGAIEICEKIAKKEINVPCDEAASIVKTFWFEPIVYPAVADRIGLLPHPHATVEFYNRIAEAKGSLEILETKPLIQSATYVSSPREIISKEAAASVADSLITALHLAQIIIADVNQDFHKEQLNILVPQTIQKQINDCLAVAKIVFSEAESFKSSENPYKN